MLRLGAIPGDIKMHKLVKIISAGLTVAALIGCAGVSTEPQPTPETRTGSATHSLPSSTVFREQGEASFYAMKYQSRKTASGERFDQAAMTAAHKKLPFGTLVRVTNLENGKDVTVRINDRGPFVKGRIIDLSRSAFNTIADTRLGLVDVEIKVVD